MDQKHDYHNELRMRSQIQSYKPLLKSLCGLNKGEFHTSTLNFQNELEVEYHYSQFPMQLTEFSIEHGIDSPEHDVF